MRLLTTFAAVARHGTMQVAAEELNVTAPAVTQAVRALEDHVGVPLLDRSTKPARLTPAGERLARATTEGLATIAQAIEELRDFAGLSGRQIVVSCTIGMASSWLMPRLPAFYDQTGGVTVNVQAPPAELPQLTRGIDVALRYGSGGWSDGETVLLFPERACPVARPEVIARWLQDGRGLAAAPLIHVRGAPHWAGWAEYAARRGLPRLGAPALIFDNYVNALQAALQGRGVLLGWRSISADLVRDGALREWPGGAVDFGTAYFLTVAPASRSKSAVQAFQRWLVAAAASEGPFPPA